MKKILLTLLIVGLVFIAIWESKSNEHQEPFYNDVIKEIISNDSNDSWVCLDYAEKLNEKLKEKGYNSRVVTGWYDKGIYYEHIGAIETDVIGYYTGHAWVEVTIQIEATTGSEINPEQIKESSMLKNP